MNNDNPHFTHIFVNNGQVTNFWQAVFSSLGCIISIICIYLLPAPEINGWVQDPFLVVLLSPLVTLFFYCANMGFQSLILKISQLPLIKYFGALVAIELMLLVMLLLSVESQDTIEINRFFKNRFSLFGLLFISLPTVFNNLISFLIEYLYPQMAKNGSFSTNVLDDNFDHNENNNENGA